MEGINTHGLQIHVKQYQGCSRAGTGKSRCCPKWDLLTKFNVHNTHQEIRALSCEKSSWKVLFQQASMNQMTESRGRIQPRIPKFTWSEFACVFSFSWRKEPATETRPGLRSGATEKCRNNSAAFPLRDAVIHSKEQNISAGAGSCKIKNSHKAQGSLSHMERGKIPPSYMCLTPPKTNSV